MSVENTLYINIYNLYIRLNQNIDMINKQLKIDLSFGQYALLKFISMQAGNRVTQKQLDQWCGLRKASISQILKVLKQKEFIVHLALNDDIRCKEVILTKHALDSLKQIDIKISESIYNLMNEEKLTDCIQSLNAYHGMIERYKNYG